MSKYFINLQRSYCMYIDGFRDVNVPLQIAVSDKAAVASVVTHTSPRVLLIEGRMRLTMLLVVL
jgi:hypothetical protein